jgi:hypothetical protein
MTMKRTLCLLSFFGLLFSWAFQGSNEDLERRIARLEAMVGVLLNHIGLSPQKANELVDTELWRQAPAYDLIGEVKALLRAKRKVEAMQLYGERTGSDFKTTQKTIEALEKQL